MDDAEHAMPRSDGMTAYQQWEHAKLDDIDCDTDAILEHIKEEKHMGEGFDMGMLAGLMNNRGVDPGIIALLNDKCRDGNWGEGGGMLILLFLIILLGGRNGFGFGGNDGMGISGVDRTVVNEANFGQLLDAVNGNRGAIENLAQTLNCDVGQIQSALCGVDKALAVNRGDIINAVQSCCCDIRTGMLHMQNSIERQADRCCCETNRNIDATRCAVETEAQQTRFLIQTTDAATRQLIQDKFCEQNAYLAQQFCDIKTREDQREIQALRDKLEQAQADARQVAIIAAVNGNRGIHAHYNTENQSICGTIGGCGCGCGCGNNVF
jgi:hypothetical protein